MIRAMRSSMPLGLFVALSLVGCGASATPGSTAQGAHSEGPPAGASNDNGPATTTVGLLSIDDPNATFGHGTGHMATGEILVPGPGFSPSTLRGTGVAGGPVEGSSSASGCTGSFPSTPQHVLKISRRLPQLRVMVDGVDRDLTLAIHLPNGQWLCNDDSGDPMFGLNPAIDMPDVGPGEFEVFVGTFSSSEDGAPPYTLGVTEDLSRNASSMRDGQAPSGPHAVPSPVPSPVMPF